MLTMSGTSCINDDFTTNSSDVLTFSTDTLSFDTVITAQSTPTKQFIVYNKSNKMISISSIKVAGVSHGKFFLNVDGSKGSEFKDVEIRGNDSIYVFVESYIGETSSDEPVEYDDRIDFVTNGVTQSVVLTAKAQDVIRLTNDTIKTDTHFNSAKPYLIYDTLVVAQGATLTLDPGADLLFHDKAGMKVKGRLIANGTVDANITLRGDRLDHVVGKIGYDIMSGQWGGVKIEDTSYGNEMSYVSMRGSSDGVQVKSTDPTVRSLHLFNSVLHNSSSSVLSTDNALVEAEGTEFSDAANNVVSFTGGTVNMAQCTFANYYLFAAIDGPIINLVLQDSAKTYQALSGKFDNCILYGNTSDVSMGDLSGTQIYFRYCLLKSKGTDDSNFINCKWGGDPLFYTVREDYVFDYRLKNKSDAIAIGNRSLCPSNAYTDRYGQNRLVRDGIDLGAYVWMPATDDKTGN